MSAAPPSPQGHLPARDCSISCLGPAFVTSHRPPTTNAEPTVWAGAPLALRDPRLARRLPPPSLSRVLPRFRSPGSTPRERRRDRRAHPARVPRSPGRRDKQAPDGRQGCTRRRRDATLLSHRTRRRGCPGTRGRGPSADGAPERCRERTPCPGAKPPFVCLCPTPHTCALPLTF